MIVGIIPARKGSVRIKNKNMSLIAGKELLSYTIDAASKSNLKNIILTTDYRRKEVQHLLNSKVEYIKRPQIFCSDDASANLYIQHIIDLKDLCEEDSICLLQPTCPIRTSKDINLAIAKFKSSNNESLISAFKIDFLSKLYNAKSLNMKLDKDNFFYYRNSSIYIFKVKLFIETGSIFEEEPAIFEMSKYESIDIDTMDDFTHAELLLSNNRQHGILKR